MFLFTSPNTMLSRNLSRKNIPKVFSGFSGGPWQLPNHNAVLSSQNHKQLQTTGGLFSKTFRANVPFVSFFFYFPQHHVVQKFEPYKYSKSFLRIVWRPMRIAKQQQVVRSPSLITSIDLQTTGGLFSKTFRANVPLVSLFFTSHHTMLSRNLSCKNIPKVLS